MTPLALLLAAAFASTDAAPLPAPAEPPGSVSTGEARLHDSWASAAVGANLLRYDGIPVTLASVRLGISFVAALRPGSKISLGAGFSFEGGWGETENGLRTGAFTGGPVFILMADRLRATVGGELGATAVRRATNGVTAFMGTAILRGALEADLWRYPKSTLFAAITGSVGVGDEDVPIRGAGGFLGLRF